MAELFNKILIILKYVRIPKEWNLFRLFQCILISNWHGRIADIWINRLKSFKYKHHVGLDILFLKCVKNKSMNFSNLIFLRISYMSHVLSHFHHFLSPLQLLQSSSNPLLNLRPLFLCYCYICYIHVHITYICVHMYICESIEYSSYLCMFRTDNVQLDNLSGVKRNGTWKAFIVTNWSNYVCMYVQLYTHVYVCICPFVHVCMVYAFTYMLLFSDYIKVLLFLFFFYIKHGIICSPH